MEPNIGIEPKIPGVPYDYERNFGMGAKNADALRVRDAVMEREALGIVFMQHDRIYDTVTVSQGAAMPAVLQFMINPATGGKTYAQTNLDIAQQLSNNDMAWVKYIYAKISFNTAAIDAANLENLGYLDVWFKKQRFIYGKLNMFPGGSGGRITAATNLGTALAVAGLGPVTSYENGVASVENVFHLGGDGYLLWKNDSFLANFYTTTGFSLLATAVGGQGLTFEVGFGIVRVREVVGN
jgi:hypothetical protein